MKPVSSAPAHQEEGGCLNAQVAWEARDPRDAEERGRLGATVGIFLREAGRPSCLLWVPFLLSTLSPAETFLWEPGWFPANAQRTLSSGAGWAAAEMRLTWPSVRVRGRPRQATGPTPSTQDHRRAQLGSAEGGGGLLCWGDPSSAPETWGKGQHPGGWGQHLGPHSI